jgi:hypothetical protein
VATLLYLLIFSLPSIIETVRDPIDGLLPAKADLRDLDCTPLTTKGAARLAPGQVPLPERGDRLTRRAVICRERLLKHGTRPPQDDAILMQLRATAAEFAVLTGAEPGWDTRRWMVEVIHPRSAVAQKISFATKNALLDLGRNVTDRTPTLAAGDIEVIGRLSPDRAWPLACLRYRAVESMGPNDALLAVVLRDHRETVLHAGICADGQWRWLR